MPELEGKTAVITGAASGIGLGLTRACLSRGMSVMLSDVDPDTLTATVAELADQGGRVSGLAADVRSSAEVMAVREAALSEFGSVHLVCNNAGVGFTKPMLETRSADWDLVLDVNLRGVVNGVDAFLPLLLEQGEGHLSATSSLSGLLGDPGLSLYNASKFAVVAIMESLGLELHEQDSGVTTSVLCPGPVATKLAATSAMATGVDFGAEVEGYLARGTAPNEVGELAISQIEEGRFWLLSHPELTFELLDARHAAMKSGQLFVPELNWTEQ